MTDDSSNLPWWVQLIVAPALSSMLIGAGGAYVGTRVALAQHNERIQQVESKTEKHTDRLDKHDRRIREIQSQTEARLTRLETKIDLLLDNKLNIEDSP